MLRECHAQTANKPGKRTVFNMPFSFNTFFFEKLNQLQSRQSKNLLHFIKLLRV